MYTIEYQKRGLPHLHLLLFLKDARSYLTAAKVNEIVCAEIPDEATDPSGKLRELVLNHMLHGPCGNDFQNCPCMTRKTPSSPVECQKRFPKEFTNETIIAEDGYPIYMRRDTGTFF